ncbi:MAG: hypothetical protein Q8R55_05535 [Candidatus Taylorbacteria bacterium]|nr:hypothetical protein [Candidatus Taylorbacteria bacterium]
MKNSYFYHITEGLDSWSKIAKEGLKASPDGYIYLVTRKNIANYVVKNQLLLNNSYGLIRVNSKGITGCIENDNVGEITAKYQRRVKQAIIAPEYLRLVNMYWV